MRRPAFLPARCQSNGSAHKLQAKLTLIDTSHSGEQVTITVDQQPGSRRTHDGAYGSSWLLSAENTLL